MDSLQGVNGDGVHGRTRGSKPYLCEFPECGVHVALRYDVRCIITLLFLFSKKGAQAPRSSQKGPTHREIKNASPDKKSIWRSLRPCTTGSRSRDLQGCSCGMHMQVQGTCAGVMRVQVWECGTHNRRRCQVRLLPDAGVNWPQHAPSAGGVRLRAAATRAPLAHDAAL